MAAYSMTTIPSRMSAPPMICSAPSTSPSARYAVTAAKAIVLKPSLKRTLEAGIEAGALGALVSGSGPTVVFLARDAEHAVDVQIALTGSGFAHEVMTAHGPVRPAVV